MALRAVIDHPKFARLKSALKLTKGSCLGYLEATWHFTGRFTPNGNIGKYSVEEIEAWVEWDGEPGELVAAMVKAKWIDDDPAHGLIVHDWHKHADDATKLSLKRAGLTFIVPTPLEKCPDIVPTVSALPEPEPEPVTSLDGKPSVAKDDSEEKWNEFFAIYPKRNGDLAKAKGRIKFLALLKAKVSHEALMSGVRRYREWCDHEGKTGTTYVAQITTWLNDDRWLEEYKIRGQPSASSNGKPHFTADPADPPRV